MFVCKWSYSIKKRWKGVNILVVQLGLGRNVCMSLIKEISWGGECGYLQREKRFPTKRIQQIELYMHKQLEAERFRRCFWGDV